jgi:ankyrin repeat protein
VSLLIDYGADLNVVNEAGNTPLHVGAAKNAWDCVMKLLIRGADRDILNKSGKNAHQVSRNKLFNPRQPLC